MEFPGKQDESIEIHVKVTRDELEMLISDIDSGAFYNCTTEFLEYLRSL